MKRLLESRKTRTNGTVKADTKQVSILVIAWFMPLLNTFPYPCSIREATFAIQTASLFCPSNKGQ